MPIGTLLNILSACTGLIAGGFFAYGALSVRVDEIAKMADTVIGGSLDLAKSFAAQRSQYIVGALFLALTFLLQLAVNVIPPELQRLQLLDVRYSVALLACLALVSFLAGVLVCRGLCAAACQSLERRLRE
jgi:hypothetical protein